MDNNIKIEQYKLFVESSRRLQSNRFFISIISALLGVLAFTFRETLLVQPYDTNFIFNLLGVFGILLNIVWFLSIIASKRLNAAKFKVIQEMEKGLPFQPFQREWEIFKKNEGKFNKYVVSTVTSTRVEMLIPVLLLLPLIAFLVYIN